MSTEIRTTRAGMTRRLFAGVSTLALLAPTAAFARQAGERPPADAPYRDAALAVDQRVQDLIGRMTLEEKVA